MQTDKEREAHEAGYIAGRRFSAAEQIRTGLSALFSHGDVDLAANPEIVIARLTLELEEARAALREVCAEYGDNDWDDDLHLGDVIEKHLRRHLDAAEET